MEITEDKYERLTEHIEKGLRYIGKAMQCLDELGEEHGYGHRGGQGGSMGQRSGMGSGMRDSRDHDEWLRERESMGERGGRYSRY